jgi:hypothetical protein
MPDHLLIELESSDGNRGAILAPFLPDATAEESMAAYQVAADHGAATIVAAFIDHAVEAGNLADGAWQVIGWHQITDQEWREQYPHLVPANVVNHAEMRRSAPRKRYRLQD